MGATLCAAVLLAVVLLLLQRWDLPLTGREGFIAIGAAMAVGIASFAAPGIPIALTLVLLGRANGDRILLGLGVISLLGYVIAYYYLLDTTLLTKSITFASTGAVLLVTRWALGRT
jgi:uncharacterized membrane protein